MKVFLGMPTYPGSMHTDALLAATHFASTSRAFTVDFSANVHSLLSRNFNTLWTHALNQAELGAITHFAMLHGDIVPENGWLDMLFEECERLNAHMVSALSPIKTDAGLTSTGIDRPWMDGFGARRLTMRECMNLPETFNTADTVAAGLNPNGHAMLVNTGCWIADLRKPLWWKTDPAGYLEFFFTVNDRVKRNTHGDLANQAESEDWWFSRQMHRHGAKYYCTRKVHLAHIGFVKYSNSKVWGTFDTDGLQQREIDGTIAVPDTDDFAKPLSLVQILEFELGTVCNLANKHSKCPNRSPLRFAGLDTSNKLDDDTIVRSAVSAYRDLGFTGLIGWIYYNEPLLQAERMFCLMERIKAEVPEARFILWTNGTLIPENCEHYQAFDQIIVSDYGEESKRGSERLNAAKVPHDFRQNSLLDERMLDLVPDDELQPCLRPFTEIVFDAYGNTHLCCYDWQGKGTWGNLLTEDIGTLAERWREILPSIVSHRMTTKAPEVCKACGHRWCKYQIHDPETIVRDKRYRAYLQGERSDESPIYSALAVEA